MYIRTYKHLFPQLTGSDLLSPLYPSSCSVLRLILPPLSFTRLPFSVCQKKEGTMERYVHTCVHTYVKELVLSPTVYICTLYHLHGHSYFSHVCTYIMYNHTCIIHIHIRTYVVHTQNYTCTYVHTCISNFTSFPTVLYALFKLCLEEWYWRAILYNYVHVRRYAYIRTCT